MTKWIASMNEGVTGTQSDEPNKYEEIYFPSEPVNWTPHEVWLTRVKQPRDRAVLAALLASGK